MRRDAFKFSAVLARQTNEVTQSLRRPTSARVGGRAQPGPALLPPSPRQRRPQSASPRRRSSHTRSRPTGRGEEEAASAVEGGNTTGRLSSSGRVEATAPSWTVRPQSAGLAWSGPEPEVRARAEEDAALVGKLMRDVLAAQSRERDARIRNARPIIGRPAGKLLRVGQAWADDDAVQFSIARPTSAARSASSFRPQSARGDSRHRASPSRLFVADGSNPELLSPLHIHQSPRGGARAASPETAQREGSPAGFRSRPGSARSPAGTSGSRTARARPTSAMPRLKSPDGLLSQSGAGAFCRGMLQMTVNGTAAGEADQPARGGGTSPSGSRREPVLSGIPASDAATQAASSPGPAMAGYFAVRINSRPHLMRVQQARARAVRARDSIPHGALMLASLREPMGSSSLPRSAVG